MGHRRLGRVGRHAVIAGGLVLALVPARATVAGELTVLYERGRVTVVAEDVALGDVVWEVGRQAGVEVHGTDDLRDPVTMHFAGASLDETLRRLLARVSHVIVIEPTPAGGQPRPTQVHVFGASDPGQAPAAAVAARRAAPPEPTAAPATGLVAAEPTGEDVVTFGPAALTPGAEDEHSPATPEG